MSCFAVQGVSVSGEQGGERSAQAALTEGTERDGGDGDGSGGG
jgi:hypothetical protein